ncbi:OmpP1/FadL family transporter [Thermodesulfobacteriota bacterium]
MKKIFLLFCVICFVLISNSSLMAGGIDNKNNFSAEYIRTLNRSAATDSLDAIVYNPAGVMKMEDGKQASFSLQYVSKDYANIVDGVSLGSDAPSAVPSLFGLYKQGKWAGFFSFTIPAGGGKVEYESGNATTRIGVTGLANLANGLLAPVIQAIPGLSGVAYDDVAGEKLEAESIYYGFTFGGAYEVDDSISFSFAARYISANKEASATFQLIPSAVGGLLPAPYTAVPLTAVLDYEDEGEGIGVIFGMNIDYEPFNISVKYESETDLDFKYAVNADTVTGQESGLGSELGVVNGLEHSRNLPAVLAVGIGYKATPKFRIEAGITSYFNEDADWGGVENYVTNGYDAGIAFEYMVNPELKFSIGYLITETGMQAAVALNEAPELDANSIGAGFQYMMNDNLKIDCGIGVVNYESDSYVDYSSGTPLVIGFEKDVTFFAVALNYTF